MLFILIALLCISSAFAQQTAETEVGELHIPKKGKDHTPPEIELDCGTYITVPTKKFTISGKATDASGITGVFLSGDDKNYTFKQTFTFNVELKEGRNSFTISSKDKNDNQSEKKLTITYKPERKDYALLIVADNPGNDFQRIRNAKKDAQKLDETLNETYGFETQILHNPTKTKLINTIQTYDMDCNPDDQLLVYLVGHGDIDEVNGVALDHYFVFKGQSGRMTQKSFKNLLNSLPFQQVLFIANTCYSGADMLLSKFNPTVSERLTINEQIKIMLSTKPSRKMIAAGKGLVPAGFNSSKLVTEMHKYLEQHKNDIIKFQDFAEAVTNFQYSNHDKPVIGRFGDDMTRTTFLFIPKALQK